MIVAGAAGADGEGLAPVGAAGAGLVPLRWADAEGLAPVGAAVVVVSEPTRDVIAEAAVVVVSELTCAPGGT